MNAAMRKSVPPSPMMATGAVNVVVVDASTASTSATGPSPLLLLTNTGQFQSSHQNHQQQNQNHLAPGGATPAPPTPQESAKRKCISFLRSLIRLARDRDDKTAPEQLYKLVHELLVRLHCVVQPTITDFEVSPSADAKFEPCDLYRESSSFTQFQTTTELTALSGGGIRVT